MLGQNQHFSHSAPQTVPYAIERFQVETQRLYGVLNQRLGCSPWLGGDHYSIADIAAALVNCHVRQRIDLANYPAVHNWYERIKQRPATAEAMLKFSFINPCSPVALCCMIAGLTPRRKPAMSQPDAIIRIKNLRLRTLLVLKRKRSPTARRGSECSHSLPCR